MQGAADQARDPRRSVRHWGPFAATAFLVTLYYEVGNVLFFPSFDVAHRHGLSLWRLEQALRLDWEPAVQEAVNQVVLFGRPLLMDFLALVYVGPHFVLTFGLFAWAYWRRLGRFAEVRNVFAAFTVLSFGFQWIYPVAPPWQVPETGIAYGLEVLPVDGSDPTISKLTNPLAALPSVHTGWAFLCAWFAVSLCAPTNKWRHLWWAYPSVIVVTIIATGNHFVLDILAAAPFLAAGFLVDTWVRRGEPTGPTLRIPAPTGAPTPPIVHGPADARLKARWQAIAHLPARPRQLGWLRNLSSAVRLGLDYLLSVPPALLPLSARLRRYPKPFRREWITARDGSRLCSWVGLQPGPGKRPALVIVPGLFTSKDNHVVRRRALKVYREWGYHVLTLDMRGNGQSERRPSTAGWKEAEDLLDVVRHLRTLAPIDGVALYAESLAGTAATVAARLAGERGEPFADLGVVAVSALHDPTEAIRLYSDPPPGPLRPFVRFFTFLLRRSGQPGVRTFRDYHEAASQRYGKDPEQAARDATPLVPGMKLTGPLLVIHSHDDELVPARQVLDRLPLARATRGLAVWVLPWGHHCLHELSEPAWFWGVVEGFLGPAGLRAGQAVPQPTLEVVAHRA